MFRFARRGLLLSPLLLSLLCPQVQAQLNGTLFTSPDERNYLNYLRDEFLRRNQNEEFDFRETEIPEIPIEEPEPAGPEYFTLSGIMTRRDGSHRIWLNDRSLSEAELPGNTGIVKEDGILALRFSSQNGIFTLKPGETLELTSGTIMFGRPPEPEAEASPGDNGDNGDTDEPGEATNTGPRGQQRSDTDTGETGDSSMDRVGEVLENLRAMPELMQTLQTMLENENAR